MVMVLRVYAMWNRSRTILVVLLFAYLPQILLAVIAAGIYDSASCRFWAVIRNSAKSFVLPQMISSVSLISQFAITRLTSTTSTRFSH